MTPIGQRFLIHFIHPPLWLWNTEHLGNSPRLTAADADPTHTLNTHYSNLRKSLKKKKIETQFAAAEPSMKIMSDFCPCFPASIMGPPGATCNYSWRMAEQMRGLWVRLRWLSGSLDNRRWLLCFRGICAAPVDRVAPHLLPNISCLIFVGCFSQPTPPPAALSPRSARIMRKTPPGYSHLPPLPGGAPRFVLGLICYLWHRLTRTPLRRPP